MLFFLVYKFRLVFCGLVKFNVLKYLFVELVRVMIMSKLRKVGRGGIGCIKFLLWGRGW